MVSVRLGRCVIALAVVAASSSIGACGSSSTSDHAADSAHGAGGASALQYPKVTGTPIDWPPTVCGFESGADVPSGKVSDLLPGASVSGPCLTRSRQTVLTASYSSGSALSKDLARFEHSTYAIGRDEDGAIWLFIIRDTASATAALKPLEQFGFRIQTR